MIRPADDTKANTLISNSLSVLATKEMQTRSSSTRPTVPKQSGALRGKTCASKTESRRGTHRNVVRVPHSRILGHVHGHGQVSSDPYASREPIRNLNPPRCEKQDA